MKSGMTFLMEQSFKSQGGKESRTPNFAVSKTVQLQCNASIAEVHGDVINDYMKHLVKTYSQ